MREQITFFDFFESLVNSVYWEPYYIKIISLYPSDMFGKYTLDAIVRPSLFRISAFMIPHSRKICYTIFQRGGAPCAC